MTTLDPLRLTARVAKRLLVGMRKREFSNLGQDPADNDIGDAHTYYISTFQLNK